jgi:hypothetical protein
MLQRICLYLTVAINALGPFVADGQSVKPGLPSDTEYTTMREIECSPTNGLRPYIDFNRSQSGWDVDISLRAQVDCPAKTWLKVTNIVGSKLRLCQTNGFQIVSTNPAVLDAFHLPEQTAVSNILGFHFRRGRVYQWWGAGRPGNEGILDYTANFKLESVFDVSPTNEYILEVTPLIYRVGTNEAVANLVEFPPVKIMLLPNGEAKKIEEK